MNRSNQDLRRIGVMLLLCASLTAGCVQSPKAVGTAALDEYRNAANPSAVQPASFEAEVDPTQQRISLTLTRAQLAEADQDVTTAIQHYESVVAIDANHALAHHRLGVLHTQTGNLQAAAAEFEAALAASSADASLHADYGYFCYLTGRWDDAERHLAKAVALDPQLAESHSSLGLLRARRGNLDEAAKQFRAAGCNEAQAERNIALARMLEEDFAGALTHYKRALSLEPGNDEIQESLAIAERLAERSGESSSSIGRGLTGRMQP